MMDVLPHVILDNIMARGCTICVQVWMRRPYSSTYSGTGVDCGGKSPCFDTRFCMDILQQRVLAACLRMDACKMFHICRCWEKSLYALGLNGCMQEDPHRLMWYKEPMWLGLKSINACRMFSMERCGVVETMWPGSRWMCAKPSAT